MCHPGGRHSVQRVGRNDVMPSSTSAWQLEHRSTHFCASTRSFVECDGNSPGVDLVTLLRRLDMVEVQCPHVAVVSADAASAACLVDQDRLHLPAPRDNRVRAACACSGSSHAPSSQKSVSPWRLQRIVTVASPACLAAFACPDGRRPTPPRVFSPYRLSQCRTVALLRPNSSAICAIDLPASTSGLELRPWVRPPRAHACRD